MKTPSLYIPKCAADFIGPARDTAILLERAVQKARTNGNMPLKLLFNGKPGIGKSALVRYLQLLLKCDKWSTTKLNGTQVKMEVLDEIEASLHLRSLFGDYRMVWVDEADQIPRTAQVRFLTLLDDLSPGACVACTSNCKLTEFENRFQSRFQVIELTPPSAEDILALLSKFTADPQAQHIATFACGNVRQAMLDVEGLLQAAA